MGDTLTRQPNESARREHRSGARAVRAAIEAVERRYLLSNPTLPSIPNNLSVVVTNAPYNAVGDGTTDNSTAIQDAINDVSAAGGGTVEIPGTTSGTIVFECKTLTLESNVILQVDAGAELQALPQATQGLGGEMIYGNLVNNFEIIGLGTGSREGRIDGNGGTWYPSNAGPDLIHLNHCSTALIQNIILSNAPHEHFSMSAASSNFTFNNVTISAPSTSPNTDGIDPTGTNFLIENCTINDGDDDIAVKPGNASCTNIIITNCTIGFGHGISIGSPVTDGVNGMTVNDVTFTNTQNGIRLKAERGSGGLVQNLTYSNISMTGVQYPILIDSYYDQANDFPTKPTSDTGQTSGAFTPVWQSISFTNITSTDSASNSVAAAIYGLPEAPVNGLSFVNVQITAHTGMQINHARNVSFDSSTHITVSTGNDVEGTTSSSFPNPVDATLVPASYVDSDIGSPTIPFDTSESLYDPDSTKWTIDGGGANISGTSDQFNYAYQTVNGNGTLSAQLSGLASPGGGAVPQAGVMYRLGTGATDPFAAVVQTTGNQIIFEYRTTASGTMLASAPVSVPVGSAYVEIVRSGSNFSGYYSTNGTSFTQIGSTVAISAIPSTANIGLAMTDNDNGAVSAAVFNHVSLTVVAGPTVTQAAAGIVSAAGTSITLTTMGSDPAGASALTYTWAATSIPGGVTTPTFDANNGTNAGQSELATVYGTGSYTFQVTLTDPNNLTATSSTTVSVAQILTAITVTPATLSLPVDGTYQFAANALDQFNHAIPSQVFTWSVTGANNSISTGGLLSLENQRNRAQVSATDGSVVGTAIVTPLAATAPQPPPIVTPIQAPTPVAGGGTTGGGSGVSVPVTPVTAPVITTTTPTSTPLVAPTTVTATPTVPAVPLTPPTPAAPSTSLQSWLQSHGLHGLALVAWHGVGWGW
jgi:polygalacturonase